MAENKRDQQIAAAESAALSGSSPGASPPAKPQPAPAAPAAPVTGASAEARYKELTQATPEPPKPKSFMDKVKSAIGFQEGGYIENYAKGGRVSGPGTARSDSIPARLSKGEYVLPADTVKKVGVQNLEQLRADTHKFGNKHEKTLPRKAMHTRGKNRGM